MNNKSIPKWFSMLLLMLVAGVTGAWAQSLTIDNFTIKAGGEKEVAIKLVAGEASVYGIQTDITLSEGLTLSDVTSAIESAAVKQNVVESGSTRVIQLSIITDATQTNGTAAIPAGDVIKLTVKAGDGFQRGDIQLSNTRLTIGTDGTELKVEGTTSAAVTLEQEQGSTWRDIKIDLTNGNLLDASEQVQWGAVGPFGIAVAEDLTVSRVAADSEESRCTVSGKWHSNQCWASLLVTVKVEGPVKVTCGTQPWSGSPVTIKNGNEVVASFSNEGTLWTSTATGNVVVGYYKGTDAATLTIDGGGYPTYIAIEKVDPADIPNDATVTFDVANAGAQGVAPDAITAEIGTAIKIPANTSLYIEGKTLTAWTDGAAEYKAGDEVTVNADMTLTPVFTANTVSFADRNAEITALWDFQQKNGAVAQGIEQKTGLVVTQITIGNEAIDFPLIIDATAGKYNNKNWQDWAQINGGTLLKLPAYKGTVYSTFSMNDNSETKFNDEAGTYENNVNTYTYEGSSEEMTINIQGGTYYRWLKAVYPVPEQGGDQPGDDEWKFRDFNTELNTLLTDNDGSGTTVTFGLSVAEDGTVSRVEADAKNTAAVVTGKTGNDHGLQNFSATVPVEGSVQITMGTCSWGGEVTVKDATGATVATFTTKKGENGSGCYKGNKFEDENIVSAKYVGDATTLTITGGAYVNFFAVEAIEASSVTVAFAKGDADCEGDIVPTGGTFAAGDKYTIPAKNFTLYKEGYTLTAWTDGTNEYATGSEMTLEKDVTLTPVFTQNEISLADRTEPVTVKWSFRRDEGAPTVQWQNQDNLVWVAQASVNGKTIDVATRFSTNPGKFANGNWNDWAQLNNGTTFKIPSCKGATISIEAYNALGTGDNPTTIDGQSDYNSGKTVSYEIAGSAETVDVVIGSEGSYYRYIQTVLPVVQSQGGGETFDNVTAQIIWPANDPAKYDSYTATPENAFSTIAVNTGDIELTGTGTGQAKYPDGSTVTFAKLKPSGSTTAVEWTVKPAKGLTFTPTKISAYIARFGTDAENGITISAKVGEEGEAITLGNYTAPRNNKSQADDKYGGNDNYTNQFVIELTEEQQTALASGEGLHIFGTVGVGNTKEGGYAEVTVDGLVNGTKESVDMYTLTAVASPEEGGSVNVYPKADEYEAGTEITLTATENFGYDFVNWTNAAGEEVSTEAKFKYTLNSNETLTANFVAVETYELALTVDGTNDYMVTVSPQPEVVDGKWMYEAGTTVVLTAKNYEGLVTFTNWSDGTTNSELTVTMDADKQITASYSEADIIAGWDFYKAGSNGRKADFAAEDNDGDALNLVNTETGETSGWLDKSTEGGGGYESFAGAAVNWRTGTQNGDVGNWHWQTKVNAAAFTDVNVQFQMLYNYNAYQTYDAEYSLDGETWTKFGSITMTGAKQVAQFKESLPEAANNQAELYIRMKADKTSQVDGAASANDGNTLAMFFITGTPKLVDDGTAPKLVSTVPENGATGASASGKVVLTFDEKVKVAEGTTATLGNLTLTPTVSGKVVTFEYKGLEYGTEYTFFLPANTVADLTNNYLQEGITLTFTTMERPTVEKAPYDAVVSNVEELMAALQQADSRSDQNTRFRIFIKKGSYTIPLYSTMKSVNGFDVPECITFIKSPNISFIGEDRDEVIITNGIPADATFAGTYGTTSKYDGIGNSDVFQIQSSASGLYWQDLTIETGMEDGRGRDLAIQDKGTKNVYKNVALRGYQDTWTSNNDNGLYYFEDGYLRGRTDYMCGKGDIYWNRVELRQIYGGYAAVPSKPAKVGWVYKDCVINGEESPAVAGKSASDVDGNFTLGRPWGSGTPVALFIDTKMNVQPSAVGWNEMSGGWPARFAEYNSTTSSGSAIDLSGRKKTFGDGHDNNPVLTAEEAAEYSDMSKMYGDWDPTLLTEQAPTPTDVKLNTTDNVLCWTGSDYALLYAICQNGNVIGFTTDTQIDVTTLTTAAGAPRRAASASEYTVRAANEMGGLSELSQPATETDGIETIEQAQPVINDGAIYNMQGVRVSKALKGVYIVNGRKVVIK